MRGCIDESGQSAGFSVDLIKTVAEPMGLAIQITTGADYKHVFSFAVKKSEARLLEKMNQSF